MTTPTENRPTPSPSQAWTIALKALGRLAFKAGRSFGRWLLSVEGRQWVVVAFCAFCFAFLSQKVKKEVLSRPAHGLDRATLRLAWPNYIGPQVKKDFAGRPGETLSPFSADDLPRFAAELSSRPWLKSIESIQWKFPGSLDLRFSLRVPYAWVEVKQERFLVDKDGILLAVGDYNARVLERAELPVLSGLSQLSVLPLPGHKLDLRPINEGLAFLAMLDDVGPSGVTRGATVAVGRVGSTDSALAEITVKPRGLPPIAWGRAPNSPSFRLDDQKLLKDLELVFQMSKAHPQVFQSVVEIRLGPGEPMIVSQST